MTDIGSSTGMTDGQIMAWLEQKADGQYSNLQDQMSASNDRSTLIAELTDARAAVDGGKPDDAFQKLDAARQNSTDPQTEQFIFEQQIHLLGWTTDGHNKANALDAAIDASNLSDSQKQELKGDVSKARDVMDTQNTNADTDATNKQNDKQKTDVSESLQSKTDDLGRIDGLALINIQQLVSDAKQTAQLASNILASRDQANIAIVGNIRG
jgi:hypothetical protein